MDVKTTFLNGDFDEEIYMDKPKGFIIEKTSCKVCKFNKFVYGLKKPSR